jgi:hypothetical protein
MNDTNNSDDLDIGPDHDDLLGALDADISALLADASTWVEPPPELGDRVVAAVRSESALGGSDPMSSTVPLDAARSRTWLRPALLGAAAAITFLFGGIVVLSALSSADTGSDTFSAELTSTGLLPDVGGDIDVTSFDSGLRIDLVAPGLPRRDDGKFYQGWVRTADGDLFPVGTFHDGSDVTLWAGVELERIELFTITLEAAAGGSDPGQGTSGDVVLRTEIQP